MFNGLDQFYMKRYVIGTCIYSYILPTVSIIYPGFKVATIMIFINIKTDISNGYIPNAIEKPMPPFNSVPSCTRHYSYSLAHI